MATVKVKAHKRKGKIVKAHTRNVIALPKEHKRSSEYKGKGQYKDDQRGMEYKIRSDANVRTRNFFPKDKKSPLDALDKKEHPKTYKLRKRLKKGGIVNQPGFHEML